MQLTMYERMKVKVYAQNENVYIIKYIPYDVMINEKCDEL